MAELQIIPVTQFTSLLWQEMINCKNYMKVRLLFSCYEDWGAKNHLAIKLISQYFPLFTYSNFLEKSCSATAKIKEERKASRAEPRKVLLTNYKKKLIVLTY